MSDTRHEDTAENFRQYGGEQKTALESPRSFHGEALAPYSEGLRLLWLDLYEGKTARFAGSGMIWLMIELQKAFDAILAKSGAASNIETAWMLASAQLLRMTEDRAIAQARVLAWVTKVGLKKSKEAHDIAWRILDEAAETDTKQPAEDAGESAATAPKSDCPPSSEAT